MYGVRDLELVTVASNMPDERTGVQVYSAFLKRCMPPAATCYLPPMTRLLYRPLLTHRGSQPCLTLW